MFKSKLDDPIIRIENARAAVERACADYSRGGSVSAMNRANRELADSYAHYREKLGLRVPFSPVRDR